MLVRSNYAPWTRSDHTGFEVMLGEMATFTAPEATARAGPAPSGRNSRRQTVIKKNPLLTTFFLRGAKTYDRPVNTAQKRIRAVPARHGPAKEAVSHVFLFAFVIPGEQTHEDSGGHAAAVGPVVDARYHQAEEGKCLSPIRPHLAVNGMPIGPHRGVLP